MTAARDLEEDVSSSGSLASDSLGASPSDDLLRALADVGDHEPAELSPGSSVGRFQIERVLGRGGMGVVYAARDEGLDRKVALKLLRGRLVDRPDRRARFLREAKAAALVDHPNVAKILEASESDVGVVLVFEYVSGRTLRERLKEEPLALEEIVRIGREICSALGAAHRAGIVHRDLKPDNVMCADDGAIKVLDFGLAKRSRAEPTPTSSDVLTVEGEILGTPGYMSPEQALGRETDARSDLFSLGVLLFELATGRRPFHGATRMETVLSATRDEAPDPRALRPALPRALCDIIFRCLAKDPAKRAQRAEEVDAALAACLAPERTSSRAFLAIGGAVLLAATIAFGWSSSRSPGVAEPQTSTAPIAVAENPPAPTVEHHEAPSSDAQAVVIPPTATAPDPSARPTAAVGSAPQIQPVARNSTEKPAVVEPAAPPSAAPTATARPSLFGDGPTYNERK